MFEAREVSARVALSMAAMIAIGGSMPVAAYGQAPVVFEAMSATGVHGTNRFCNDRASVTRTPERIAFQSSLVGDIMAFAYDLPLDRIERRPQWMYEECYDVAVNTPAPASLVEQKRMLLTLLEERFGLVARRVSYPSPVYFLIRGPKVNLTEAAEPDAPGIPDFRIGGSSFPPSNTLYAQHVSIGDLAVWLSQQMQLPVLDKTGITGLFDIEVAGIPVRVTEDGINAAIRKSIGLALEKHEGTAESLIVEHVEKPKESIH